MWVLYSVKTSDKYNTKVEILMYGWNFNVKSW